MASLDDSAHPQEAKTLEARSSGKSPRPPRPPLPPPPLRSAAAPAAEPADGEPDNGSKGGWSSAGKVLQAVQAARRFRTLRDLLDTDAYIEPQRLVMLKALGEGAFAKVQHAELLPAEASPTAAAATARGLGAAKGGGREVAVKMLRTELLEDPAQVELFVREVALLRKLRNRNIVEFVGCSWSRGSLDGSAKPSPPKHMFYVQEYCSGGSLGDLVRRQMINPFRQMYSDADALRWCMGVAGALQYLHEARPVVIHRDLKLENVMLTDACPGRADAKLGDFGLARLTPPADRQKMERLKTMLSSRQHSQRGSGAGAQPGGEGIESFLDRVLTSTTTRSRSTRSVGEMSAPHSALSSTATLAEVSSRALTGKTGSWGYMSPEVAREQQYNSAADIFSLAMVMYNLFCRTIPTLQILLNGDESHLELYAAKVAEGYRPPMLPMVPKGVQLLIEACWKSTPELRPTAREVLASLEAIQASGECGASKGDAAKGGCCSLM